MTHTFIPAARERVRVNGLDGIFFVLSVDRDDGLAYAINVDPEREGNLEIEIFRFEQLSPVH